MEKTFFKLTFLEDLRVYMAPRVLIIFFLGVSCGIPLYLMGSTFAFWLAKEGVSYTSIGLLSLALLPRTVKFLWSPLVDRLPLPYLTARFGRRRSWLLLSQFILISAILFLSTLNPGENIPLTAFIIFVIDWSSSTQSIVMLAYEVESLKRSQYGPGEAMGVFGYRIGMVISGAGAFYLSTIFSWNTIYMMMGGMILIGVITTLFMAEPAPVVSPESKLHEEKAHEYLRGHPRVHSRYVNLLAWLYGAVVCPFLDLMRKKEWLAALCLILLYKLGDNLMGHLTNIFYGDLGFSNVEIANASKLFGMWCSVFGGIIGGVMVMRLGFIRALFVCGIIHGVANFMYLIMYHAGHNTLILYLSIGLEHITSGMRLAALYSYEMILCTPTYAATQMAIFTSVESLGRNIATSPSGWFVDILGWEKFLYLVILGAIPGILIVIWLARIRRESLFFAPPLSKKLETA